MRRRLLREFRIDQIGLRQTIQELEEILNANKDNSWISQFADDYDEDDDDDRVDNYDYGDLQCWCYEKFGDAQCGSSRIVCEYDDSVVIKIALPNGKGIYQNELEYELCTRFNNNPLFPRVYYHDPDFRWIVAERVLLAQFQDFEYVVGLPFNDYNNEGKRSMYNHEYDVYQQNPMVDDESVTFHSFCQYWHLTTKCYPHNPNSREGQIMEMLCQRSEFLSQVRDFILNEDPLIGDLMTIRNWGLAERNGKPTPVLLDCGLDKKGYDNLYRVQQ